MIRAALIFAILAAACATLSPVEHARGFAMEGVDLAAALAAPDAGTLLPGPADVEVVNAPAAAEQCATGDADYEVLGHFRFQPARATPLWPADYGAHARNVYCRVQLVLTYGTALLWALTPFSYPCFAHPWVPAAEGDAYLRRAAKLRGATRVVTISRELDTTNQELYFAEGCMLKPRASPQAAPPDAGP